MSVIATTNLALRFVLELAGLAALGFAGFQSSPGPARWLVAVGAPAALALFWAVVVAPGATNPLTPAVREVIGSVALLCAAGALALAGRPQLALGFAVLIVTNHVLLAVARVHATGLEVAR